METMTIKTMDIAIRTLQILQSMFEFETETHRRRHVIVSLALVSILKVSRKLYGTTGKFLK